MVKDRDILLIVENHQGGGTICLSSKFYDAVTFPRSLMRDCRSQRQGLLMHNKMMFVRGISNSWVYLGSHNLSESAWYVSLSVSSHYCSACTSSGGSRNLIIPTPIRKHEDVGNRRARTLSGPTPIEPAGEKRNLKVRWDEFETQYKGLN